MDMAGNQSGIGGFLAGVRQAATQLADAAANSLQQRIEALSQALRLEMQRAIALSALAQGVMLFVWTAAVFAAAALLMTLWDGHRVAAAWCAAGGFLATAALGATLLLHLRNPSPRR